MLKKKNIAWMIGVVVVGGGVLGIYLFIASHYVYIDQSVIEAPIINLSPTTSGTLQEVFVKEGDAVSVNEPIARVGDEIVKAQTSGIIASIDENIGAFENAVAGQATVATMVDPTQLRVVGHLDEDKGLRDIQIGDVARFTVDAFGTKIYDGVVDEISQVSQISTTSNIFNQRPTNEFDIKVRFDPTRYPELKSGMSARIWVYKN